MIGIPTWVADLPVLETLNAVGLVAFAFSGASKGMTKDLDLFGVIVLGLITALGGGAIRDLLVGEMPQMLENTAYPGWALIGVVLAALSRNAAVLAEWPFLLSDALGLAVFTAAGCECAASYELGVVGIVTLGLATAIGGGIIRDLLAGEVPLVLRAEVYATCSIAGGLAFWGLERIETEPVLSSFLCAALVFVLRLVAVRRRWQLPRLHEDPSPAVPDPGAPSRQPE